MDILKHYVDLFNKYDEEVYKNVIDNEHAYEWLKEEIPLFECPDADLERTYYFRWWTYRKHLRMTDEGYIITEFLPTVRWSGKDNSIVAAVGHHLYEGRWLKNSAKYLSDYVRFFFNNPERSHRYSSWLAYSVWRLVNTNGDFEFAKRVLPELCRFYEVFEETHGTNENLFWSIDNADAMEYSIGGTDENRKAFKGIRPTLNSYMCADAYAISEIAKLAGEEEIAEKYKQKYTYLKEFINNDLFEDGFYRAYKYDESSDFKTVKERMMGEAPREEIGYIPWMFNIPPKGREAAFDLLLNEKSFYTDFGIATAERSHPRFLYKMEHECLWNGYVWPFATSQTLTALLNVIDNYGGEAYKSMYIKLLTQYAKTHTRVKEDGSIIPWIDEVRHPLYDDWSSRTILRDMGWLENKGGYERGKDYNHSTFCDLVISGIVGIKEGGDVPAVKPCIPEDWDYFRLSGLNYRGKTYTVTYDKSGNKYGKGKGLTIEEIK